MKKALNGSDTSLLESIANAIRARPRLAVQTPQGACGLLAKESVYAFTYGDIQPEGEAALGLPYRVQSYASGDLFGIFSMNEPEGSLRLHIEDAMSRIGIPNKLFLLLLSQGLQIGRVSYRHADVELPDVPPEDFAALLRETDPGYFSHLFARYALRSGLSGAQPKILVPYAPSQGELSNWTKKTVSTPTLIVKVAGGEFPGLSLNEFFCQSVARRAGLPVPDFHLSDDGTRYIISRFDRGPENRPIGFEDMAVLAGRNAQTKYLGSYEQILRITATYCRSQAAVEQMFARIALSAVLKDGDAHLKNFGLIYDHPLGEVTPAPVYDVVCTDVYPALDGRLALKMNKSRMFPDQAGLLRLADTAGVSQGVAREMLERIETAIDQTFEGCQRDPRFERDTHRTLARLREVLHPTQFEPRARPPRRR